MFDVKTMPLPRFFSIFAPGTTCDVALHFAEIIPLWIFSPKTFFIVQIPWCIYVVKIRRACAKHVTNVNFECICHVANWHVYEHIPALCCWQCDHSLFAHDATKFGDGQLQNVGFCSVQQVFRHCNTCIYIYNIVLVAPFGLFFGKQLVVMVWWMVMFTWFSLNIWFSNGTR
jgi:hypothetical protein